MADYCTLADLKARMGVNDTSHDAVLAKVITASSRAIDRWCNRPDNGFVASASVARIYDVPNTLAGPLHFAPDRNLYVTQVGGMAVPSYQQQVLDIDPAQSISQVAVDADGDGTFETIWAATDYDLLPLNAALDGDPYRQIRQRLGGAKSFVIGPRRLQLTGIWGESTSVPAPVEQACLMTAHRLFKRGDAPYGVIPELTAEGGVAVRIGAIDPDVKRLLASAGYIEEWVFV